MLTIQADDLCLVLGENASPVEARAAGLLAREVLRRTGLEVPVSPKAPSRLRLLVGTPDSGGALAEYAQATPEVGALGPDGFHLCTEPDGDGRLFLVGQSPSGVVAGVGKLLRLARYGEGTLLLPQAALTDTPRLPIRGIYFATHFRNFYHVAPLEAVDRVIEDFALWGGNQLMVWFDMHHFQSFQDPAAQEHLARLKHFGDTAHSLGMRFGLTFIANEAYDSSPVELRADPRTGTAHYERELCPSKPGALELIGRWQAEVLDAFPQVDLVWMWPYDQGGCACPDCAPWGANGFLRCSEQLARLTAERRPGAKRWLSTWLLDQVRARGEYEGLFAYVREQQPEWFDGLIVGTHGDWVPEPLLERPFPERYPLAAFPEISMYRMNPWGEHGANPLPDFNARLGEKLRGNIVGGWPYSEGIYEDLNKFWWCRACWNPEAGSDDTLAEYATYYLSPDVAERAVRLFHLMEQTHARNGWRVASLEGADEEWRLAQEIDAQLTPWARESWRWRLLHNRAAIDGILQAEGFTSAEAQAKLKPLCDEIAAIYHATDTFIRPPAFPAPPDPRNVAQGKLAAVSSCLAGYEDRAAHLTDGVLAQDDGENFWVHDKAREATASVTIDLGEVVPVESVRLQYRGIHGVFWFVPESVSFEVSADGERFERVTSRPDVPREGDAYRADLWTYPIGRPARHVRVLLGKSQHTGDQYAGTLELTEVQVIRG